MKYAGDLGDLSRRFISHLKVSDAILTSVREDLALGVGEHRPPDRYAVDDRARADTAEINRRAALRRKGWGDWGCRSSDEGLAGAGRGPAGNSEL